MKGKSYQDIIIAAGLIILASFIYSDMHRAEALDVIGGDGILFYGDGGNNGPRMRTYASSTGLMSAESAAFSTTSVATTSIFFRTSPTKQEGILAWQNKQGFMEVYCYDGTSWTLGFGTSSSATLVGRRWFDVAYEKATGDALVVFSHNVSGNKDVGYITKAGNTDCAAVNWSTAQYIDLANQSGIIQWVIMDSDPNPTATSSIAAIFADASKRLTAKIWNGTQWLNEPSTFLERNLEIVTAGVDTQSFDIAYEATSSELLVGWGNLAGATGVNGVRYATMTGGQVTGTWTSATTSTFADDGTGVDLAPNPYTNEILITAVGGGGDDTQVGKWNGGAFVGMTANADISCNADTAGYHTVGGAWTSPNETNFPFGTNRRGVAIYADSGVSTLTYFVHTPPTTWGGTVGEVLSPAAGTNQRWFSAYQDPFNSHIFGVAIADSLGDLHFKIASSSAGTIRWDDTENSATVHENTLPNPYIWPATFDFWQNIPYATTTQAAYQWFFNKNSLDVNGTTTPLQDQAYTATSSGAQFRLRTIIDIGGNQATSSSRRFALQYAVKSGTCDTGFSGESYYEVTSKSPIAFYDNSSVSDGQPLTANSSDPTYKSQTVTNESYEENNFASTSTAIPSANVGKWDFSLYDNNATAGTSYCFRLNEVSPPDYSWEQIGGDGINSSWTGVGSVNKLLSNNGTLYAGIGGADGTDEVWKYDASTWTQIGGDGLNSSWTGTADVFSLEFFQGELFAGNSKTGATPQADVWKYNGSTWTQIGGDGLNSGWTTHTSVQQLFSYGDKLYAGLGSVNSGDAEVWSWDGSTWTQIGGDGLNSGWTGYLTVFSIVEYGGEIHVGTGGAAGEDEVWKWNGSTWTQIGGDGLNSGWTTLTMVHSLLSYNNKLYAGTGVGSSRDEVWSWNGTAWTKIGGDGVNSSWNNQYSVYSLAGFRDRIYAGTGSGNAEIWDYDLYNATWTQIGGDGLNGGWSIHNQVDTIDTNSGTIYVGLGNLTDDADVWASAASTTLTTYAVVPELTTWARPTISQAYDMIFNYGGNASNTATLTVTDVAGGVLASSTGLRIAIATSSVNMIWDTSDTQAVLKGSASTTRATSSLVQYEGGGSVLYIPLTAPFAKGENLIISGLSFKSFNTATSGTYAALGLFIDGGTDQAYDATTTTTTVAIRGVVAIAAHTQGQITDRWDTLTSTSTTHFRIRMNASGENITMSTTTFSITGVSGVSASDITSVKLYIDADSNGYFSTGDYVATSSTTTRPNAAGTFAQFSLAACGANWDCVEEDPSDEDEHFAYLLESASEANGTDAHNLANSFNQTGAISNVRVTVRAYQTNVVGALRPLVVIGGTRYKATASSTPTGSYANYSADWATDPSDSNAWTWSDIDSLQAGVYASLPADPSFSGEMRVTQIWADVMYEMPDGAVAISGTTGTITFATSTTWPLTQAAKDYVVTFTASNLTGGDTITLGYNFASTTASGTISMLAIASTTGGVSTVTHTRDADASITISGNVYILEDQSTNISTGHSISLSVNGAATTSVLTTAGGAFSFTSITAAANDAILIYIENDATYKGTLVSQTDGTNLTGLAMYTDKVVLHHQTAGPMTDTIMRSAYGRASRNVGYATTTTSVIFNHGTAAWVDTAKTYTPGEDISVDDLVATGTATFVPSTNLVTVRGSWRFSTTGTLTNTAPGGILFATTSAPGKVIDSGGKTIASTTINGSGTVWTIATSTLTVSGTTTIAAGTLNTNATDNKALTSGTLNINGGTLVANASTITLNSTNAGAILFTRSSGTFTAGTSAVVMSTDASVNVTSGTFVGSNAFSTLTISPTITANRTYNFGTGNASTTAVFTINPASASTNIGLNVLLRNWLDVASTASTTIRRTSFATSSFSTNGSANNFNTGHLEIFAGGEFTASSTVTVAQNWLSTSTNATSTLTSSTVIFNTTATSTITGTTTFATFQSATPGKALVFHRDSTLGASPVYTFSTFTITGATGAGNLIDIKSDLAGSQWKAHFNSLQTGSTYARVKDSGCNTGTANIQVFDGTSVNVGNNDTCWIFTSNTSPAITNVSFNTGNAINLNEGTFKWATASMLITDAEYCSTIASVSATAYRASTTNSGTSCSASDLTCYQSISCLATSTGNTCGASDPTVDYDCGFKIWYIASPTDTGDWASSIWSVSATTSDTSFATSTATNTNQTVDINTLSALDVTVSLSYGSLVPGADTGSTNSTTTVTNTGNTTITPQLSGTAMSSVDDTILVGQQQYSTAPFIYSAGSVLTAAPTALGATVTAGTATTTPSTRDISWGLGIPSGKKSGSYTGSNTIEI